MFISKFYQNLLKIGGVEAIQIFCKVPLIEKWALYNRAQIYTTVPGTQASETYVHDITYPKVDLHFQNFERI